MIPPTSSPTPSVPLPPPEPSPDLILSLTYVRYAIAAAEHILAERYKEDAEHRYIYFFSRREFQKKGAGGAAPGHKAQKEPRLMRAARGGGWKASGGGQNLRWPRRKGGFFAGRMMTLVFYDRGVDKSKWGMHEFVVPVHEQENLISSPPTHVSIPPNLEDSKLS